jgi:hypothetical protein
VQFDSVLDGLTPEFLRVRTAGAPYACSFLYALCGLLMGYERVITYPVTPDSKAFMRVNGAAADPRKDEFLMMHR